MGRPLPTLTAVNRWAAGFALASMLLVGWMALGHQAHAPGDGLAASCHEHACHEHDACATSERSGDSHDDHDEGSCALCQFEARLPDLAPTPVALPDAGEAVDVVILGAPDAPSVRRARPRVARGPPSRFAI